MKHNQGSDLKNSAAVPRFPGFSCKSSCSKSIRFLGTFGSFRICSRCSAMESPATFPRVDRNTKVSTSHSSHCPSEFQCRMFSKHHKASLKPPNMCDGFFLVGCATACWMHRASLSCSTQTFCFRGSFIFLLRIVWRGSQPRYNQDPIYRLAHHPKTLSARPAKLQSLSPVTLKFQSQASKCNASWILLDAVSVAQLNPSPKTPRCLLGCTKSSHELTWLTMVCLILLSVPPFWWALDHWIQIWDLFALFPGIFFVIRFGEGVLSFATQC